jgi:hypothetical protein
MGFITENIVETVFLELIFLKPKHGVEPLPVKYENNIDPSSKKIQSFV